MTSPLRAAASGRAVPQQIKVHGWKSKRSRLRLTRERGPVAQLDRASDFGSEGWGFDSLRGRHSHALDCRASLSWNHWQQQIRLPLASGTELHRLIRWVSYSRLSAPQTQLRRFAGYSSTDQISPALINRVQTVYPSVQISPISRLHVGPKGLD